MSFLVIFSYKQTFEFSVFYSQESQQNNKMSGIRIHWKGNDRYIMKRCRKFSLGDKSVEMSVEKVGDYCLFCYLFAENYNYFY